MPGEFVSVIKRVREGSDSLRVTLPDGVAKVLGAVPEGSLIWKVDLRAGLVTVIAASPAKGPSKRS